MLLSDFVVPVEMLIKRKALALALELNFKLKKKSHQATMVNIPKRRSQRLSRRKETLLKKLHEIATLCDVDVAFFLRVRKTGRMTTYRSLDLESWPPLREQMVINCPNMKPNMRDCG